MNFSDETLMAYVDDELDALTRSAIDRALGDDPGLAARIERHRSVRRSLRAAYDPVLDEPVPDRLLAAARTAPARSNVVSLHGARTRPPRRWTVREWTALAASLLLGAIASPLAFRLFDATPLTARGGRLVASGALASALTSQLASEPLRGSRVAIGVTFISKSGDFCRTFTLRERESLAGLACRTGGEWQVQVLANGAPQAAADGSYRQASSSIPPAVAQAMDAQIAGEPLDARAEAAARARDWRR